MKARPSPTFPRVPRSHAQRFILDDFFPFCDIRVDLSKAAKGLVPNEAAGQVYYKLDYDVIVLFGLTELQAQLCWKTKVRCEASQVIQFPLTGSFPQDGEHR